MLTLDSRNFHGWGYRRVVVSALESQTVASTLQSDSTPQHEEEATAQGEQEAGAMSMVEREFAYTTRMISTNLSNFSAWHNRSKLIPRLLYERSASSIMRRQLLDDEFGLVRRGLWTDPYDQSLWFYHDYLMSIISSSVPAEAAIVLDLTDEDRRERLRGERDSIEEMLEGAEDCKWIYQALLQCTAQYLDLAVKAKNGDPKHSVPDPEVKNNMRVWLEQLKTLDPLRMGRWDDLHNALQL
ncbi:Rab geranylgeranyltransferase [Cryomyces antarcticus]|uniref:Geranylgeranyl transferase type-2 subunit alpha n=1 Tax=Cryomyces antarcticus TaxID=329879 RepID=A0ABR0LLK6_9PEZI|nr:Rab geranylgeranyltransferase [Cryomyces antarcticus]KAK5004513.1 Rab geranylgeranyltransferase [Cryomyces antarcticus]KAK5196792.1 Rab geranylgeranyltransferase [Cryomyces antarcticus]